MSDDNPALKRKTEHHGSATLSGTLGRSYTCHVSVGSISRRKIAWHMKQDVFLLFILLFFIQGAGAGQNEQGQMVKIGDLDRTIAREPASKLQSEPDSATPNILGRPTSDIRELLAPGKSAYVVAVSAMSRDLSLTSANLVVERETKEQFKKEKRFRIAKGIFQADFVFIVYVDMASPQRDEIALAVPTDAYKDVEGNLDALRAAALWQSDAHFNAMPHVAASMVTLGLSMIVDKPSVCKGLVRQFHKSLK